MLHHSERADSSAKILAIDDDNDLLAMLRQAFVKEGYRFLSATGGVEGLQAIRHHSPDLVLLDLMLPRMDGWEVCRQIRHSSDIPIIMLTALGEEKHLVRGLELGADDYVIKPFSIAELKARVQATLRRYRHLQSGELRVLVDDRLIIDRAKCCPRVDGNLVPMSSIEYRLLNYLVDNTGRILTHQALLSHIRGWEYTQEIDYLKVYIHRLRKKIEPDPHHPAYIITERGLGYRFQAP